LETTGADHAIAAIANKASVAGGGIALWGGMTASDLAAIGGLLIAGIGLCVQWYYKRKGDRRDEALHQAEMDKLRG
jgi:hypothetical protein